MTVLPFVGERHKLDFDLILSACALGRGQSLSFKMEEISLVENLVSMEPASSPTRFIIFLVMGRA